MSLVHLWDHKMKTLGHITSSCWPFAHIMVVWIWYLLKATSMRCVNTIHSAVTVCALSWPNHPPNPTPSVDTTANPGPLTVFAMKEHSKLVISILEIKKKTYTQMKLFKFHIDFWMQINRTVVEVDPISVLLARTPSLHIINAVWQSETISPGMSVWYG